MLEKDMERGGLLCPLIGGSVLQYVDHYLHA